MEYASEGLSIQAFPWSFILFIRCLKTPRSKTSSAHLVTLEILVKRCKEKDRKCKAELRKEQDRTCFVNFATWLANRQPCINTSVAS